MGFYPITHTIHHTDQVIIELIVGGEHIETTPEHPFYVEGKGWVEAEDLTNGMHIYRSDGSTGMVWLQWTTHRQQEMYNLTVATAHTFFVGEGQWLVHNAGGCPNLPTWKPGDKAQGVLDIDGEQINLTSGCYGPVANLPANTLGMSYNGVDLAVKDHVEAQAAAVMRQQGLSNADLYINKVPCSGPFGCDSMLPHIEVLPENAGLNVYLKSQNSWELYKRYIGLSDSLWK